jgi:hypothetical protein
VRPAAASISASKSGDILGEYLKVSITGEKNATAVIQINTSTGRSYRINGQIDGNGNYANNDLIGRLICGGVRYTISVSLVDKAGNVGFISNISGISTTDCPVCGESSGLFEKPIHNNRAYIAHPYGYSNNYFGGKKFHYGVDYNGVSRGEPIYSTALGRVIETVSNVTCENCPNLGYGNYVKVDHGSGIVSVYAHLQTITVRVGDIVGTNTKLGTMGSTGFSDGPHLHFAVERYGRLQDPKNYLGKETSNLDSSQFAAFCKKGGSGSGTAANPWDSRTADNLGRPKILIKEFIGGRFEKSMSPAPEITYIDNNTPGQVTIYGLGIYKYQKADYKYEKEYCSNGPFLGGCWFNRTSWETIEESEKDLQNTQIALYIEGESQYNYVADLWNDATDTGLKGKDNSGKLLTKGKWVTNATFNGDSDPVLTKFREDNENYANRRFKYGDKVCVKSIVFENFQHGEYIESFGNCKQVDVKPCSTTASGFDRCKAGEEARKYGEPGVRSPKYPNYTGSGGNCTNFASQVLHEGGGLKFITGNNGTDTDWFYFGQSTQNRSASWAGAPYFYNHMTYWSDTLNNRFQRVSPKQSTSLQEEFYSLEVGDVISLNPYPHNLVVSDMDNNNVYIAGNTYDFPRAKLFGDKPSDKCLKDENDTLGPKLPCFKRNGHKLTLFKVR